MTMKEYEPFEDAIAFYIAKFGNSKLNKSTAATARHLKRSEGSFRMRIAQYKHLIDPSTGLSSCCSKHLTTFNQYNNLEENTFRLLIIGYIK